MIRMKRINTIEIKATTFDINQYKCEQNMNKIFVDNPYQE